jgi:hypothetical protein
VQAFKVGPGEALAYNTNTNTPFCRRRPPLNVSPHTLPFPVTQTLLIPCTIKQPQGAPALIWTAGC